MAGAVLLQTQVRARPLLRCIASISELPSILRRSIDYSRQGLFGLKQSRAVLVRTQDGRMKVRKGRDLPSERPANALMVTSEHVDHGNASGSGEAEPAERNGLQPEEESRLSA